MSNELALLDVGLPSYLKDLELDDVTKALMGGGSSGKRISIRGSVFRMLVNGKEVAKNEERAMNVVIVNAAAKVARTYYAKQYAADAEPSAPDCWSADGDFPDAKATKPQASRCMDCPMNVKGSGQGDSRACRFSQRLAVVMANNIGGDIFQLTLPSASLFGEGAPGKWPLQTYAKMVGSKGIPITALVTEMKFDTDSTMPKLTFRPVRVLEKAEIMTAIEQGKSEAATRAITMTVTETDGVKAPQIEAPKKAEAPKEVEAVVEVEVPQAAKVEPEVEPVKRTAKKDEAVPPKKDLSSILSEWDDA